VKRLVFVAIVLVAAIIVCVVFGWLAGVAVVLAAITIPLLVKGAGAGLDIDIGMGRNWGRDVFGSDDDDRER
jgi:hypothetical protein